MPTFLTEPQWYDQSGQLVGPETFIAKAAQSLQALSGSIFGDVPLQGKSTNTSGKHAQIPLSASSTPIYILPKIYAVKNDPPNPMYEFFPESDPQFFYAMILNYIALNCKTTDNTSIKEGIYIGAEVPASRRIVMIYVYPDTSTVSVTPNGGAARNIVIPGWSHGIAFGLGGDVETFGTESTTNPDNSIKETKYSYNNGIKVDNLIAGSDSANIGAVNNKFDKVYANSFVGNADTATAASTTTGVQIGTDRYAIYVSGSTMTFKKENS